jgi:hypothetical protein
VSGPDRVDLLRQSTTLVGIDFVRVSADQRTLFVFLHHRSPLPAALATVLSALAPESVFIEAAGSVLPARVAVMAPITHGVEHGRVFIRLPVSTPGGFGGYRLRIEHASFDPYFNDVPFSFKAGCESDADCKTSVPLCAPAEHDDFPVDYRGRDFWSLRASLLDFAAQRYPDWQDRLEADVGMVIVEILAALGDEFAYAQDRIARETHLDTASQRRSLRHLARLVDYQLDDGSGAQVWLDVTATAPGVLSGGTAVSDAVEQRVFELGRGLRDAGKAFPVTPERNELEVYIWDEDATCLPAGSRSLTLRGHHAAAFDLDPNIDVAGKWVLLTSGPARPGEAAQTLMVRVLRTGGAEESTDPLTTPPTNLTRITWDQPTPHALDLERLTVHANLLPATSGRTRVARFRVGPADAASGADGELPRTVERVGPNAWLGYGGADGDAVKHLFSLPGSEQTPLVWLRGDDGRSRPELLLARSGDGPFQFLPALIGEESATPTAKVFTLEDGSYRRVFGAAGPGGSVELVDYASDQGSTLRFGDGELGLSPADGSVFEARYRLGNGRRMNVAAETLVRFVDGLPAFVSAVSNPMSAVGGADAESPAQVRIRAPEAFRHDTWRAVRPEDFVQIGKRELGWLEDLGAEVRWTGSWPTVFVTPDPRGRVGLSEAHEAELDALVWRIRQAGRDARVREPVYATIDLKIRVCVEPTAFASDVRRRVLAALFGEGEHRGFFDPDRFTFGTGLSRAQLLAAIQAVPGVYAVEDIQVRRRGLFDWRSFRELSLHVAGHEIVRVVPDARPGSPGAVQLVMAARRRPFQRPGSMSRAPLSRASPPASIRGRSARCVPWAASRRCVWLCARR